MMLLLLLEEKNNLRCKSLNLVQIRRNKRSMEQFYDAKYLDTRDKKSKSGTELFSGRRTRNKNLNNENLRVDRGHKLSKGKRAIKTKRYPYRQGDIVVWNGQTFAVRGVHCKGTRAVLHETGKSVALKQIQSIRKVGGICSI